MATAMRAPLGDFRDWDAIRAWGDHIAGEVLAGRTGQGVSERIGD